MTIDGNQSNMAMDIGTRPSNGVTDIEPDYYQALNHADPHNKLPFTEASLGSVFSKWTEKYYLCKSKQHSLL